MRLEDVIRQTIDWDFVELFQGDDEEPGYVNRDVLVWQVADAVRDWMRDGGTP